MTRDDDESLDATGARFVVMMDDHEAMAGRSPDDQIKSTRVKVLEPTIQVQDGVHNLRATNEEEGRISDEAREFVIAEIDAGRIVIDAKGTDVRRTSLRAAIFSEFEDRLRRHRQNVSKGKQPARVSPVATESAVNPVNDLMDFVNQEDGPVEHSQRPKLGVTAPRGMSSPSSADRQGLADLLGLPGFDVDVTKQPRIFCELTPEDPRQEFSMTFAAHWYWDLGGSRPTDMLFVIDKRDVEARDAISSMIDIMMDVQGAGAKTYYAKVTREITPNGEREDVTKIDITCVLPVGFVEIGIFSVIMIPMIE